MKLVDANVLLYAYNSSAPQHQAAKAWFADSLNGVERVGFAWLPIVAFLRLTTNVKAMASPLSMTDATGIVSEWLAQPVAVLVEPGAAFWDIYSQTLIHGQAHGNLVNDAYLAALAIEHGATLYTTDRDFSRFPGLKLANPLT